MTPIYHSQLSYYILYCCVINVVLEKEPFDVGNIGSSQIHLSVTVTSMGLMLVPNGGHEDVNFWTSIGWSGLYHDQETFGDVEA